MITIKDAIHKDIPVADFEKNFIDHPVIQRLRRIKQLGLTHMVYPSAMHSRFEHSIGSMHLAGRVASTLQFSDKTVESLRLASLFHDIGHFPYSHIFPLEHLVETKLRETHVSIGQKLVKEHFSDALNGLGIKPKTIIELMEGKGKYGSLVSGGIDIDKMDYLVRDSYFTGTAYGMIDISRLLSTMRFQNGTIAFEGKDIRNVEAVAIGRFMMLSAVYFHPTVKVAEVMFSRVVQKALEQKLLTLEEFIRMDDLDITSLLRQNRKTLGDWVDKIESRDLFKIGSQLQKPELSNEQFSTIVKLGNDVDKMKEIETEIAQALNIKHLLINIYPEVKGLEDLWILDNGLTVPLGKQSMFAKTIDDQKDALWRTLFCVRKEDRDKAEQAKALFLKRI